MSAISADVSKEQLEQLESEAKQTWQFEHQEDEYGEY